MFPLLIASLALGAEPAKYAKPDFLVEAVAVKVPDYRILDLRPKEEYAKGHIPGAANVSLAPWIKAVNDGKADAKFWKAQLAEVGVDPKTPVLVVAEDIRDLCRGWWLLKLAGVPDARILNGGWTAYKDAKLEVSQEAAKAVIALPHDWKPEPRLMLLEDVVKTSKDSSAVVVDARADAEFEKGRIPGAKHLEWLDLIDAKTKKFKAPAELSKLFAEQKIDLTKPCVTYCQGGGRAAVMAFGLELMGATDVKNYHKSWGEYGADEKTLKEKK